MSKRLAALATLSLAATAIVAACNSSPAPTATSTAAADAGSSDASHPECTPGERVPCVCAAGGFGIVVCSGAGTSFGACTGCIPDAGPAPDGATDATVSPTDAAADATTDGAVDSGPASPTPALVFVHAAPGVPPVRLCFGAATGGGALSVEPVPPLPDAPATSPAVPAIGSYPAVAPGTPGIYPGTIGALPPINELDIVTLTLYAVLSSSISGDVNFDGGPGVAPDGGGREEDCVQLLGAHGLGTIDFTPGRLTAGTDFFPLVTIPAGALAATSAYLLSLTGCLAGAVTTGAATCGAGYDGGTSVGVGVAQLDTTTLADGGIGAQFAHRSTALEGTAFTQPGSSEHSAASSGVTPVFLTTLSDGGVTYVPLQASHAPLFFGSSALVPSPAGTYAVDPTSASTQFGVVLAPTDGGTSPSGLPYPAGDVLALPLGAIQLLSDWSATTTSASTAFASGATYTFVLVGDPAAPALTIQPADGGAPTANPAYDGRGLHFVAFPNQFTARGY